MKTGIGIIAMVRFGMPVFAEVIIEIIDDGRSRLFETCSGEGFQSQGTIEYAPRVGYDDWKSGALSGISPAFRAAGVDLVKFSVCVKSIKGVHSDTNATIVSCATMLAVWDALNFNPSQEMKNNVLDEAARSWGERK